jgi:RND family efflux transporter MFP subunit
MGRETSGRVLRACMIALAGVLLAGCDKRSHSPPSNDASPRSVVRAVIADTKGYRATEDVVGTVRAKLRASIEAKIAGRVDKALVAPGDVVRAGDLLVQLDAREIQSRLDQAIPVLRNAEMEMKRFKSLVEKNAVSQSEFDATEARFRVAQAAVNEAETMLGYTKVSAPFAGVITRKLADVGDLASPGRALLEIEDPKSLRVEADVPESLIDRMKLGSKMNVTSAAAQDNTEAVVSEIAPAADSATRTFLVKLDLPANTSLRAGQFARVAVPLDESKTLRVPASAIIQRGQMELVFVAQDQKAQLRLVKTGKRIGNEIEIVSGVIPGERVIVENTAQLRDGQPIEVKP